MKPNIKKYLIIASIVIAIVLISLLCLHYFPFWVNLTNVITLIIGVFIGWGCKFFYDKYILNKK